MKLVHPKLGRECKNTEDGYQITTENLETISYRFTKEELLNMGFEEIKLGIPDRFNAWLLDLYEEESSQEQIQKEYSLFLKHYPKQDTLPVEEIIDKMKERFCQIDCDESGYRHTPRKDFEDILRTYAIKDTSTELQELDVEALINAVKGEGYRILQKTGYNIIASDNSQTTCRVGVEAVKKHLSKYGTLKITESQAFDVEDATNRVWKMIDRLVKDKTKDEKRVKDLIRRALNCYSMPKIPGSLIEQYTDDYHEQEIIRKFAIHNKIYAE